MDYFDKFPRFFIIYDSMMEYLCFLTLLEYVFNSTNKFFYKTRKVM